MLEPEKYLIHKLDGIDFTCAPSTITVGVSLEVVEAEAVSCVLEKLVNRVAEDGWEFTDGGIDYQNFRRPRTR